MQGGQVLQRSNKINKEDTYITYFPKTAYWRNLSPNSESVEKTINSQSKNTRVPPVAENEAEVFLLKHNFSV